MLLYLVITNNFVMSIKSNRNFFMSITSYLVQKEFNLEKTTLLDIHFFGTHRFVLLIIKNVCVLYTSLLMVVLGITALWDSISVYIGPSPSEWSGSAMVLGKLPATGGGGGGGGGRGEGGGGGGEGGAVVLGKLPVPGRPTIWIRVWARAYCAYSRCGLGLFGHFYSHLSFLSSFSLSLGAGPI